MDILTSTSADYNRWANDKLDSYTNNINNLMVEIKNPLELSKSEKEKCLRVIKNQNMVFFNIEKPQKNIGFSLTELAHQFGMGNYELDSRSDVSGLTKIQMETKKYHEEYIPYTNKPLNWHTDGYYNSIKNPILSWLLYCESPSDSGGMNKFMDHEIAYILYNQHFQNMHELMEEDVHVIPENKMNSRLEVKGYVFGFINEKLHMRFSMRGKNIVWKKNIIDSINSLKKIIKESTTFHVSYKLMPGQGVLTNNVIHMRTTFTNTKNKNRLLYRLRSKKRICD
jgi:alpha-ketoglutarate-dependent taurine dioxygenase|tara:strand:- start:1289 stop:2134 length:846 start_codon:yes stop_codon:yes gene_type:complete